MLAGFLPFEGDSMSKVFDRVQVSRKYPGLPSKAQACCTWGGDRKDRVE